MTLAARRASLLVAFYLISSAATASAECAWVLWGHFLSENPTSRRDGYWEVALAFDTLEACKPAQSEFNKNRGGSGRDGSGYKTVTLYTCLPDTLDPRGFKAK